jgi:hypothetical protein
VIPNVFTYRRKKRNRLKSGIIIVEKMISFTLSLLKGAVSKVKRQGVMAKANLIVTAAGR